MISDFRYIPSATGELMDIVYLRDLKISCVIGVWEWERRIKQTVAVDLDMAADVRAAASSDRLEDTLDYKAVTKRLIDFVEKSEFHLVETLAEKIAAIILTEFSVSWVRVRINKKGAIRGASEVGVVIERGTRS